MNFKRVLYRIHFNDKPEKNKYFIIRHQYGKIICYLFSLVIFYSSLEPYFTEKPAKPPACCARVLCVSGDGGPYGDLLEVLLLRAKPEPGPMSEIATFKRPWVNLPLALNLALE